MIFFNYKKVKYILELRYQNCLSLTLVQQGVVSKETKNQTRQNYYLNRLGPFSPFLLPMGKHFSTSDGSSKSTPANILKTKLFGNEVIIIVQI